MRKLNQAIIIIGILLSFTNCGIQNLPYEKTTIYKTKFDDGIPVLNVATFHMRKTPDATFTEFDENDKKNQEDVRAVARLLAEFKPTVIIVEDLAINDSINQANYLKYIQNPNMNFEKPSEIELLAFEVGRLSGAKRIHGINHKEEYNYNIGRKIQNQVDKVTNNKYYKLRVENEKNNPEVGIPFYDLFKLNNHPQYLESLITINADLLTYISSDGKAEGADEAAKFYHRNLVMFSNFNQIELNSDDRVFILMGGSHTAFFGDFIKRSPKYRLENIFEYLK